MVNSLPFLQDPKRFLQSYFWGCNEGYDLSRSCRLQIEQAATLRSGTGEDPLLIEEKITESLLNCYVHTKVCQRCRSIEQVTCQAGYKLLKERDAALDEAFSVKAIDEAKSSDGDMDSLAFRVESLSSRKVAQQKFLDHMKTCAICALKQPQGRYSISAWSIDVARSLKVE